MALTCFPFPGLPHISFLFTVRLRIFHVCRNKNFCNRYRAPDKLRICVFYSMKTSKNACIIISECTHYAYILLCKQTFQIRSVLVQSCTYQYNFVFEKFPVITSLYTFRRRERTKCLPF